MVAVVAGSKGKEEQDGGAGEQTEYIRGLGQPGLMAKKIHFNTALFLPPDDITCHGDNSA